MKKKEALDLSSDPYISYSLKPGWTTTPEHTKHATHNSLGFRGEEYPIEKPEGVFRIVCVGGSSTYGNGPTDDDKTWPSRLQDRLNKRAGEQRFHVINCGAPMWGTTESLINLALRGVDFEPDLVLVYHNTNDASPAMWPNPVWDTGPGRDGPPSRLRRRPRSCGAAARSRGLLSGTADVGYEPHSHHRHH